MDRGGNYNNNNYQFNQQNSNYQNGGYLIPPVQKHSGMGIAAFVLALLGCTSILGLIFGIVDIASNKQNKHGLSIAAIVISVLWILCGCVVTVNNNDTTSKKVDSQSVSNSAQETTDDNNTTNEVTKTNNNTVYHIGDTIDVSGSNGEYTLCITGISETSDRNQFSDKQADRVVIIDYNFENISYNVEFGDYSNNELSISEWDFSMYDADGNILETYPADTKYAQSVSPGHKSSGQMAFALNNDENYIEAEYHDNFLESSDFTIELTW